MTDLRFIETIILLVGFLTCIFVAIFSALLTYQSNKKKNALLFIELSAAIMIGSHLIATIFDGSQNSILSLLSKAANCIYYIVTYVELFGINHYLEILIVDGDKSFNKSKNKNAHTYRMINILIAIGAATSVIFQLAGLVYYYDENNVYHNASTNWVSYVMPLMVLVAILLEAVKKRVFLSKLQLASFVIVTLLPIIGSLALAGFELLFLFNAAISVPYIIMFVLALSDQNRTLAYIAFHDEMTDIYNTYGFSKVLQDKINDKSLQQYNAVYFGISNMTLINQKYGYEVGDAVIRQYEKALEVQLGKDEAIARFGGDFFLALIRRENSIEFMDMMSGVDLFINALQDKPYLSVAAVAGVYEILEGDSPETIMSNVSLAFKVAKLIEKKPYAVLTQEKLKALNEQRQISSMIPAGMAKDEFKAYYQPKVNTKTRKLCGAEALVRWEHEGELIPPYKFVPLMEYDDTICQFDFYMLEHVCRDMREWIDKGWQPPTVSVNFSRKNLGNLELPEQIYEVVKKYDVPTKLIQIEITETLDDYPIARLKEVVDALHEYGFTTAIDDFGTGSSSIKLLKDVSFDVLKIDKSFVDSISDRDRKILEHIAGLAKEVGASTIAEGVEHIEQIDVLTAIDCTEIQGYYFDKPLTKEVFEYRIQNPIYTR